MKEITSYFLTSVLGLNSSKTRRRRDFGFFACWYWAFGHGNRLVSLELHAVLSRAAIQKLSKISLFWVKKILNFHNLSWNFVQRCSLTFCTMFIPDLRRSELYLIALPHKNMKIVNFWGFYHIQLKGIETLGTKNDVLEHALQLLFLVN